MRSRIMPYVVAIVLASISSYGIYRAVRSTPVTASPMSSASASCTPGPGEICAAKWWTDDLDTFLTQRDELNGIGSTKLAKQIADKTIKEKGLAGVLNDAVPQTPAGVKYTYDEKRKVFIAPVPPKVDPGATPSAPNSNIPPATPPAPAAKK